uniref:Integrin beta n=1 Tax=Halocynthia roretzi TaxID=7729 RepID=Q75S85_HALRO|nr:integrin beta Hr1 precursor [Halocynthia roretzi]
MAFYGGISFLQCLFSLGIIFILFPLSREQMTTADELDAICEEASITTCDACIRADPRCSWCVQGRLGAKIKRCRAATKQTDCALGQEQNPRNVFNKTENREFSAIGTDITQAVVQLRPQKIDLELRKGAPIKFNITYRKVSDYPVDLYYVMDLSHSMTDDLVVLQKLGTTLANDIRNNVTQNIQLGFGTFVDKVMMPFTSTVPEQLKNPCVKNPGGGDQCAPPFGFRHQQSISSDLDKFRTAVESTKISGNIDSPEGGFDALMQIAVCSKDIGWRDEATHLVVFTTDASFHMALDGKLAAILEMNDLKCHLTAGANKYLNPSDIVYSKSKELDYPSIGQLRHVFSEYKIQPIFAVTGDVLPLYEGLKELIPNSYVDQLASDSSNIIDIIKDAYNNLKGKLEMNYNNKPPNVDLKYRVLCPSEPDWKLQSLRCDNITIGSEVVYEFEITATSCPPDGVTYPPMTFTSSSLQESVTINFGFKCSCDCTNQPIQNSPQCNTNGSLVCGICSCYSPHEGAQCQCTRESDDVSLIDKCKKGGPQSNDEICEGNGICECGTCNCDEGYSENFCQCSNKGCPKNDKGLCGGPVRGTCHNCGGDGRCICMDGWTLHPTLGTCSCNINFCKVNATDVKNCTGNGECACDRCRCDDPLIWSGEFCETCIHPSCKEVQPECQGSAVRQCAECVHTARRNRKNADETCKETCGNLQYLAVAEFPACGSCGTDENCARICDDIDQDIVTPRDCLSPLTSECDIKFKVVWKRSTNDYHLLVKEFDKNSDCRDPINPLLYVLPIVAGIVLIGLIALAVWKVYQTMRDKKEWENFEREMKQSRWTKDINPVFVNPSAKFENPSYGGDM